jgi:hypothetical protein
MARDTRQPTSSIPQAIQEPADEWVPLRKAPYYSFRSGFITSQEGYVDALHAELSRILSDPSKLEISEVPEINGLPKPEYSLPRHKKGVRVDCMGIWADFSEPGFVSIHPEGEFDFDRWIILGEPREVLKDEQWDRVPSEEGRIVALWHREKILRTIVWSWRSEFSEAVRSGAAHNMGGCARGLG